MAARSAKLKKTMRATQLGRIGVCCHLACTFIGDYWCVHVHIHICVYENKYIYMYIDIYIHTNIHACVCIYIYRERERHSLLLSACVCIDTCMYISIYRCNIHIPHTHTHTHTQTHARAHTTPGSIEHQRSRQRLLHPRASSRAWRYLSQVAPYLGDGGVWCRTAADINPA